MRAWSSPPVDDVGYIPSRELLGRSDDSLRRLVEQMLTTRYGGWRNHNGLWRDVFGLDTTEGMDVLDFGCGVGIEALELAAHNRVTLADISADNIALATRVLALYGRAPVNMHLVSDMWPLLDAERGSFDVFYCNGVLHHVRWPRTVMQRAHELLRPGGEARLMLYSDIGWRQATGTEPPEDTEAHPMFGRFVRHFDQVGDYADWYDRAKVERMFGDLFTVERFSYITPNSQYLGAVLRRLP